MRLYLILFTLVGCCWDLWHAKWEIIIESIKIQISSFLLKKATSENSTVSEIRPFTSLPQVYTWWPMEGAEHTARRLNGGWGSASHSVVLQTMWDTTWKLEQRGSLSYRQAAVKRKPRGAKLVQYFPIVTNQISIFTFLRGKIREGIIRAEVTFTVHSTEEKFPHWSQSFWMLGEKKSGFSCKYPHHSWIWGCLEAKKTWQVATMTYRKEVWETWSQILVHS